MDDKNYDEFGHYIGPDLPEINSDDNSEEDNEKESSENDKEEDILQNVPEDSNYNVTLNENIKLYPTADEVFPDVENLVMEEDTQPFSQPISLWVIARSELLLHIKFLNFENLS